ncbi:SDR family NAD(P)-dependent oxidoreductase [bacterium]|nr:SDR family NAD(P)-dependent oxidoreductase [bacterium]
MKKKILITGANSGIAKELIKLLRREDDFEICLAARSEIAEENSDLEHYFLDVSDEQSVINLSSNFNELYALVNFAGIAVSSPIEYMDEAALRLQFDTNFFGLFKILKNFARKIIPKCGRIINISSMASFGIFPFISPYCSSKAAGDVILNLFSVETGIKTVSIKPGVIKTPFWSSSIKLNENNFKNFVEEYEKIGEFLIENSKKNEATGLEPKVVAKVILKALKAKNPSSSYVIGRDAKIARLTRFIPQTLLNKIIRFFLLARVK